MTIGSLTGGPIQPSQRAESVAAMLAAHFLRRGNYNASTGPITLSTELGPTAAASYEREPYIHTPSEFAELQVQSVGFEEGTDDPAVHLYLTRGTARLIRSLPKSIEGVRLVIQKMGPVTVRPDAAVTVTNRGNLYERFGRICCGSSCAPTSENCAGTLGALVRRNASDQLYLLSNNHVLAGCNHVPWNQPILSPSSIDGRPEIRAPREIGRHEVIEPLTSGSPNFINPCAIDLALARATDPNIISSWQGNDVEGYDTPTAVAAPLSMMRVKKVGRTTGLTHGEVEAKVTAPTPITYNAKYFKGVVWFREVWTVRSRMPEPFALNGDSGSLVVAEDGFGAVGVVFAANTTGEYAWIVPMPAVVAAFGGLQLIGGHGV